MNQIIPSYKMGWAKRKEESAYPELWRGLVGLWSPSLGATGGTLYDWVGGNHGTLNTFASPPTSSSGWWLSERGHILAYDGGSDYVPVPYVLPSNFTIAGWVNPGTDNNWEVLVGWANSASQTPFINLYSKEDSNDRPRFRIRDNSVTERVSIIGSAWDTTIWHHLAATRKGDVWSLYQDGVCVGTGTWILAGITLNNINIGRFGRQTPVDYQSGYIGDVLLSERAFDAVEIADMFAGANPLTPKRRVLAAVSAAATERSRFLLSGLNLEAVDREYLLSTLNLELPVKQYVLSSLTLEQFVSEYLLSKLILDQPSFSYLLSKLRIEIAGKKYLLSTLTLEQVFKEFFLSTLVLEQPAIDFLSSKLRLAIAGDEYMLSLLNLEVPGTQYISSVLNLEGAVDLLRIAIVVGSRGGGVTVNSRGGGITIVE